MDFYLFLFQKRMPFFIICNDEKSKVWRRKIIKDIRNLIRLKKEQNGTVIKDIRNLFRLKKKQNDTTIKDTRNSIRLKKEVKCIKDVIHRSTKNIFWVWKWRRKLL